MGHLRLLYQKQLAIESLITNCRLNRHLISTSNHKHGSPAENKHSTAMTNAAAKAAKYKAPNK
jgi:hypothetical protein